jgi:hypothetical protein
VQSLVAVCNVSVVTPSTIGVNWTAASTWRSSGCSVPFAINVSTHAAAEQVAARLSALLLSTEFHRGARDFFWYGCRTGDPGDHAVAVDLCNETSTTNFETSLQAPLERRIRSLFMDGRAATPRFTPRGTSASCAVLGANFPEATATCAQLAPSAFQGATITLDADAGATVHYTMDSCPLNTDACNRTGSPLAAYSPSVAAGATVDIISVSPTGTVLPVNLTATDVVDAALGVSGTRTTGTLPRVFTVKAFAKEAGKRNSLNTAWAYALPAQAETPGLALDGVAVHALGWCDGTEHSKHPYADGDALTETGGCSEIHTTTAEATTVCNSALAVPCATGALVCTAGALSRTVPVFGYYDGAVLTGNPASVLARDFGPGQTAVRVESAAALGFTNEGALLRTRRVRVGENGDGQSSFPALVVTAVDQATNTLTVEADITTSFTLAGSAVQIIDQCEVGAPRKTAPVAPDVGWLAAQRNGSSGRLVP